MKSTIYESFELPSKGMIYDQPVNPMITLRSMTTMEEMKRLSPTDTPYKVMSDIIESCMETPPDIHVYNMSLGDYQFLLHKLRIVTYGTDYKMMIKCKDCGELTESIANLESLEVNEWNESIVGKQLITLPKTNKQITLRFQTPRDLDTIAYRAKEMKKKTKQNIDYSVMFTLMSLIKQVDGTTLDPIALEEFVKSLPNRDANYILNKASDLNKEVGLNNIISLNCGQCGALMEVPFRITSEFFGPTTD